jgi:hypothetical protein
MSEIEIKDVKYPWCKGLYKVFSDGRILNLKSNKFLTIYVMSPYNYCKVTLIGPSYMRTFYLHVIIAEHFLPPKPEPNPFKYEVNHKDLNKTNNNRDNLEWITHQQNMIHARQNREWESSGRKPGFIVPEETKYKMAIAKYKPVKAIRQSDNETHIYKSIEDLLTDLSIHRKSFNRYVNSCKTYKGYSFRYIT